MSNVITLLHLVSTAQLVALVSTTVIPAISQYLAKRKQDVWVGLQTGALSVAAGFFSTWAAAGSHFQVRTAIATSGVGWLWAGFIHSKVLDGTGWETWLINHGVKITETDTGPGPGTVTVTATDPNTPGSTSPQHAA